MGILSQSKPVLAVLLVVGVPFAMASALPGSTAETPSRSIEAGAGAPVETSASFTQLPCQDFDGVIKVTLEAADGETEPVDFVVMEDGQSYVEEGDEQPFVTVAPGATRELVISGLPDGPRTIEVSVGETSLVPEQEYMVECDDIPTVPYSNAKANVYDGCMATAVITVSNKPIRGVVDLLQPVEFVVTATPEGGEPSELDRFLLPAEGEETPYVKELMHEFEITAALVHVVVTADGETIASSDIDTGCIVLAQPGLGPDDDGLPLPNTGV